MESSQKDVFFTIAQEYPERLRDRLQIDADADFDTGTESTDLIIKCEETRFHVHKKVVCPQSKFLKAACEGGFKEALSGVIELEEDLEFVVRGMLQWMYCPGYFDEGHLMDVFKQCQHDESVEHDTDSPECQLSFFGFYIGLHELADKYDVPELAQDAYSKFDQILSLHCYEWLHRSGFTGYMMIVDRAYSSAGPNDVLRAILVKCVVVRCQKCGAPWESSMCGLILEHREFAEDLLRELLTKPPSTRRWYY